MSTVVAIPIGTVFGDWTTVGEPFSKPVGRGTKRASAVLARCSCGATHEVYTNNLRRGLSTKCPSCKVAGQIGLLNYAWQGEDADYSSKHGRVVRRRGLPESCVWGCSPGPYDWACVTGDYDDVDAYAAMCRTCHGRFDRAVRRFLVDTSTDPLIRSMHARHTQTGVREFKGQYPIPQV